MRRSFFAALLTAFCIASPACTQLPEVARPALAPVRLANGYHSSSDNRWRLGTRTTIDVQVEGNFPEDQKYYFIRGLRREFPLVSSNLDASPGLLSAASSPAAQVRVFVRPLAELPRQSGGLASLPGQLNLGPGTDVSLLVTWIDLRSGHVIEQSTLRLRRRWLLGGGAYLAALEDLAARHAVRLKSL